MMLYTFMLVGCLTMTCHGLHPPGIETCSVTNQACEVRDNLIDAFPDIFSFQECRELCENTPECEVYSYHGQNSSTFKRFCMTFSKCSLLNYCEDCFTEFKPCFDVCDILHEGSFFQDTVDVITNIPDEPSCVTQCRMNQDCKFYTYYTASDADHPSWCMLLSDIKGPIKPCLHCRTGFPDCKNMTTNSCHFSVGDNKDLTSYKATDTDTRHTLVISAETLFISCDMTIVAIGGGGSPRRYGGGGSGYIKTATISSISYGELHVYVGAKDKDSSVFHKPLLVNVGGGKEESRVLTAAGEDIVRAHPGKPGDDYYDGGDGYSGGGGGGDYHGHDGGSGGSNGGDGERGNYGSHPGGKGSGLDISTIALEHFKLTPAAGGKICSSSGSYGGGGGGVLVDGQGPQKGRSYGAGGCPFGDDYPAQQGIVLIEIKKKQ